MNHEQGICPICGGANIDYDDSFINEDTLTYPARCEDCKATFYECYAIVFDDHYYIHKHTNKE